jgi:2-keto-4-pentenoate hydratase/2-oxohepta-3-ene-1,7-dioic acid hydratase in catechol pathway
MIYTIPVLVEYLTRSVTMRAGDIMSTGTAGGTGLGRHPQEFMHPGDSVTVGVEGVGYLTNPQVAGWTEGDAS